MQGHQGDPDVAELAENAVEGRLVGDRTAQDRRAVLERVQFHAVEPGGPVGAELALQADLVPRPVRSGVGDAVRHGSPRGCASSAVGGWVRTAQARSGGGERPSPLLVRDTVNPAVHPAPAPGEGASARRTWSTRCCRRWTDLRASCAPQPGAAYRVIS